MTFEAVEAGDLVDFGHRVSRNHKARGLHVVLQLAGLGGAGDHTADLRVLQDPCHGKHRQVRAELVGHLAQLLDLVEVLIGQQIVDLVVGLPGGARAGRQRLALAVLAGQQTLRERGERGDADAELAAGAHDLMLDVTVV